MAKVELRYLVRSDRDSFFRALNEKWEKDFDFVHYWESMACEDFGLYIKRAPKLAEGKFILEGHVPATFLFAFNTQGEVVGRVSIRHELNEFLLNFGGHIGYGVCPSKRRNGYATAILRESIAYVENHLPELDRVLVTCDEGNIGSQKTIERNGGMLENILEAPNGIAKRRYWIDLDAALH